MKRLLCCGLLASASALAVAAMLFYPSTALGQSAWKPDRTVELITGSGVGSAPDQMIRTIQEVIGSAELLPVPTTVLNRTGGSGALGWAYLNKHPGDGHYIMLAAGTLSVGSHTGSTTISYRDLTAIALLAHEYIAFAIRADSPIKDGRDLIEQLKKDPTSVSFGTSSVAGSMNHLAVAVVLAAAGVDFRRVRVAIFDGAGKTAVAMLGGHVDVAVGSTTVALTHLRTGKARIIGYTAPRRLGAELAKIPTWQEQGLSDVDFSNYRGIIGPRGMTNAQVAYWEDVFARLDKEEKWRAYLEKSRIERDFRGGRETRQYWDNLDKTIKPVIKDLGLLK
jgi:putative tricarboxylic transport membrane protein